jgi:hypothetical protein
MYSLIFTPCKFFAPTRKPNKQMLLRPRPLRHILSGQRHIWDWAAANPELPLAAVGAVALAARWVHLEFRTRDQATSAKQQSLRAQELQDDLRSTREGKVQLEHRTRELELEMRTQATRVAEQAKQMSALRDEKSMVEVRLQTAEGAARKLQGAAEERGRHGERVLEQLLAELKSGGYAESYSLQPEIGTGKRPDAVVTLVGGKWMVVDSKAPRPPSALLETGCEDARKDYVANLKRHISELGAKHYHAADERALDRTWLLLPGEGYLQAAYAADGSDSSGLHEYAAGHAVTLVGPNGLRSTLQHHTLLQLEVEVLRRLEDGQVQQRLRQLQPRWTEDVLPRTRTMGRDLKKMVATFNELSNVIKTFDVDLRAEDALNMPKARKTQLPPDAVGEPAEEHLEADGIHCRLQTTTVREVGRSR